MENLKLTRIDFRLIHGQVMTRWAKKYDTEAIVVIDDRSASSALLKKILLGAAPAGIEVTVESVESAAAKWKAGEFPTKSLIILFILIMPGIEKRRAAARSARKTKKEA